MAESFNFSLVMHLMESMIVVLVCITEMVNYIFAYLCFLYIYHVGNELLVK